MGVVEEAHNVKVIGSGNQATIVLGHGFGTDQSVWKHLVPHLVDDYRIVLYDNMGAGTTNPDYFDFDRYSTLEGFSFDLIAIMEDLQIESCIFVGHSVSAMVGVLASLNRPDLFSKIVMISASPRYKLFFHISSSLCFEIFCYLCLILTNFDQRTSLYLLLSDLSDFTKSINYYRIISTSLLFGEDS